MKRAITMMALTLATVIFVNAASASPLKIFILAGQSNMQGHAQTKTLDHLGMDPTTQFMLNDIRDADGKDRVFDDIWISSLGSSPEVKTGKLTTGYGASGRGQTKIGPELTFGIYLHKQLDEPILIIKTAWGGKSLHTDFRPPGAGPYEFSEEELARFAKQGKDIEAIKADRKKATGFYYRAMMEHIQSVLADVKKVYPRYDASEGHELAGFVWFQGWNDMVARDVYPDRDQPGGYAKYSEVLTQFIKDVRTDLNSPDLPFVIGVMGTGGPVEAYSEARQRYASTHANFRKAMAAPASLPEFKDSVKAVFTEESWDLQLTQLSDRRNQIRDLERQLKKDESLTDEMRKAKVQEFADGLFTEKERQILETGVSNAEYHYLGSAKILGRIGKSFADAMVELLK